MIDGPALAVRPLVNEDIEMLGEFLANLSSDTREFSTFDTYDEVMAKELCDAINKYDKLRLVVESDQETVGLLEFSFGLPGGDLTRFKEAGYELTEERDCRFGITLSDKYQDLGLGGKLMPIIKDVAKKFGKERIILWGGVFESNKRAVHYYEKHGFKRVTTSSDDDGKVRVDIDPEYKKRPLGLR
ncbi:MAG: GNAT family N-acetyltransferase [Candidatus Nomurabacteria bacterium]|nr:MAG: GNAT family N-acetyltransferase [Candidatus Nomurabacteria bacterium]